MDVFICGRKCTPDCSYSQCHLYNSTKNIKIQKCNETVGDLSYLNKWMTHICTYKQNCKGMLEGQMKNRVQFF